MVTKKQAVGTDTREERRWSSNANRGDVSRINANSSLTLI